MANEIVPTKKLTSLTADELRDFREDIVEITAVYEEGASVLEQIASDADRLKAAGDRYYELSKIVTDKVNVIQARGIIGRIAKE